MIEVISKYENISPYLWDNLVQSSDTANFFQTRACYDFYASLSFLKPFVYAIRDEKKLLALTVGYIIADGNLIKKFFSKRAIVPGGMMIHSDISEEELSTFLNFIKNEFRYQSIYLEFRNYNDYSKYKSVFTNCNFEYNAHLNFQVDTRSIEFALSKLSSTKLRDVRNSYKNGAEVKIAESNEEIKELYALLKHLYETKVRTPIFPQEFFEKLFKSESGIVLLVKLNGKIIGGSVLAKLPGKVIYEWFVCGLDGEFKGVFPSTLATWASIEYAAHYGYSRFDMMGAGKPEDSYGVRNFKSKFGGELVEQGRFLLVNNSFLYSIGKLAVEYIKKKK